MSQAIPRLRWRRGLAPGETPPLIRTQRWRQTPPPPPPPPEVPPEVIAPVLPGAGTPPGVGAGRVSLHRHDFYEFFWVDEAAGRQPINGRNWRLSVGDIVFIRPDDAHEFAMIDAQAWGWTNVGIAAPAMARLKRRYAADLPDWPWRDGPMPLRLRLSDRQCAELKQHVAELPVHITRWIDADWLVAGLLRLINHDPRHLTMDGPPQWFAAAVEKYRAALEANGDGGDFIRYAGRSMEHVNRVCQRYLGMTTTQYLTTLRLDRAARLLRFTRRDVLTVAADCGFENLSYFHRRFKQQFGVTPRRFRMQGLEGT